MATPAYLFEQDPERRERMRKDTIQNYDEYGNPRAPMPPGFRDKAWIEGRDGYIGEDGMPVSWPTQPRPMPPWAQGMQQQPRFSGPAMFPGMTRDQVMQGMFGMQDGPGMFGPGGAPPRINRMYGGGRKPWAGGFGMQDGPGMFGPGGRKPWRGGFGEQQPRQWNFPDMTKPRWGGQSPIPQDTGTPGEMDAAQLARKLGLQPDQLNSGDIFNLNEILKGGGDPTEYVKNAVGFKGIPDYAGMPANRPDPQELTPEYRTHGVGMQRNRPPLPRPPGGSRRFGMQMRDWMRRWR